MKSYLFETNTYAYGIRGESYKNYLPRVRFGQVVRAGINLVDGKESWACSTCQGSQCGSDHHRCMQ